MHKIKKNLFHIKDDYHLYFLSYNVPFFDFLSSCVFSCLLFASTLLYCPPVSLPFHVYYLSVSLPFHMCFLSPFLFMCVSCLPISHVHFLSPFLSKYLSCLLLFRFFSVYLHFNGLSLFPFLSLGVSFLPFFPYIFPVSLIFKCENSLLCSSGICAWLPSFSHNIYRLSSSHLCSAFLSTYFCSNLSIVQTILVHHHSYYRYTVIRFL
jgi:hypothetical protein